MTENETTTDNDQTSKPKRSVVQIVLGILFLIPALVCCVVQLLIPTTRTFWLSFQDFDLLRPDTRFVGVANYDRILTTSDIGQTVGYTITFVVIRLLVVAIVPPLLAWATAQLGRSMRLGARGLLTVPLVISMPTAIGVAWLLALQPNTGIFAGDTAVLANPDQARSTLLSIDALYSFALACGLGLILYLPVWRRSNDAALPTFKEVGKPFLALWGVTLLAVAPLTLGTIMLPLTMTEGGPVNSTQTLGMWIYQVAFQRFNFGPATAMASVILITTVILGTLAGLLIIFARLRLTTIGNLPTNSSTEDNSQPSNIVPTVVFAVTALLAVGACALGALPFGSMLSAGSGEGGGVQLSSQIPVGVIWVNSFGAPSIAAIAQLSIAYMAALSLGVLQPFGKRSHWLLVLFSPWLFITLLPLSLVSFITARDLGTLDSFTGLISPILFSVPALFILTLFFKGQVTRWQTALSENEQSGLSAFFKHVILPSLPLAGVLLLALFFVNWQEAIWPFLASRSPENYTWTTALLVLKNTPAVPSGALIAGMTTLVLPVMILFLIIFVLLQLFYLDRLVIYSDTSTTNSTDQQ